MNKPYRLILILSAATVMFAFQNCSGVGFNQSSGSSNTGGGAGGESASGTVGTSGSADTPITGLQDCTNQLNQISTPVKLLFVLDTSGSNTTTDPGKHVRGESLQSFFDDYHSKANFNWGMIDFSGTTASAIINGGNAATPSYTTNLSTVQSAITSFMAISDTGNTPYAAALAKVSQAIANDSSTDTTTKYIVVFESDGEPNPAYPGGDTQLMADVASIYNLRPGQVSINTVFYGGSSAADATRLQNMATAGHGQFLNTFTNPTGTDFGINDLVTIPGVVCH